MVPGASRSRIAGPLGNAVKIAVAAPPEAGKANAAVVELLARVLSVRRGDVQIRQGHTTPRKRVRVLGLSAADILARLSL